MNAGEKLPALLHYDVACRALAEAKRVDEVKDILDVAVAMACYARKANNRELEADVVAIRLDATRKLGALIRAQRETVGLNTGTAGKGRPKKGGLKNNPPKDSRPTLASQGIDKNLAHDARVLDAMDAAAYERKKAEARDSASRVYRRAIREVEILQERQAYAARTEQGGTVDDLNVLAASGCKAGTIYVDVPSKFEVYSGKGKQRSAERYYNTMSFDELKAMGPLVQALATKDCALLYWTSGPLAEQAHVIIREWDFAYKTYAFIWIKTTPGAEVIKLDGEGLHWGMGYTTRANAEVVLLATRGSPLRLAADVHQVVIAPVGEHSEKPDEVYRRIERLYPGPYLELFARKKRPGWKVWGNEVEARGGD